MNNHHEATTREDRNWVGDMNFEEGRVERSCPHCGLLFTGFKRRKMCRACRKLQVHFPSLFIKSTTTVLLLLSLVACGRSDNRWVMKHEVITQEERDAVDAHVKAILGHTPGSHALSGHDQDMDDYANAVYVQARYSLTPPRMFELHQEHWDGPWEETGRWKSIEGEAK